MMSIIYSAACTTQQSTATHACSAEYHPYIRSQCKDSQCSFDSASVTCMVVLQHDFHTHA